MELLQKNCQLWAKFQPKQALLLPYIDCQELSPLYSLNPQIEARDWFQKLDLEKVFVLCVYGIGLGYYYDIVKPWLREDPSRRLVFLEDNLQVLRHFFDTSKATEILEDSQVHIIYFEDLKDNENVLEDLYWNFAMTRILVTALNSYAHDKKESFSNLHQKIAYDFAVKNALVEEYLKFGGAFFINFYQNILELPGAALGNKTFGSFYKVPAIICGAGPSLIKSLPFLASLGDKALIFAGGSALNALNAADLQPHLGAGIDPNPAQYSRLKSNQAFEVPFYYRNRMHHQAFKLIQGPRLYVTGSGGYDISDYYEKKLHIKSEFLDEGHNVINFCLQIAHQLGCNPILFVGMDLAFTEMKTYAPGIEDEVAFDPNKAISEEEDDKPIVRKDIYGEPIHTLWKWVAESEWIGDFAKEHLDVTLINCTEGGIGFPSVPNDSLQNVAEQYLTRQYPIADRLNGEIQNSLMTQVTLPKLIKMTQDLKESLQRCVEHLTVLIEEALHIMERIKKENQIPKILQSGYAALCETELAEEPGYQYVLEIFNAVQMRILSRELNESKDETERTKKIKKIKLNVKRLTFLRDAAKFNIETIQYALSQRTKKRRNRTSRLNEHPDPKEVDYPGFNPKLVPESPQEGDWIDSEHVVRLLKQYGKSPKEARLEKDAALDGQCVLYYLDGSVKANCFYQDDKLHGPSTFYSKKGRLLSKSYFVNGLQEGESRWYYPTGEVYAIRHFKLGKPHGEQLYFYPNGTSKTILKYHHGKLFDNLHKTND